MLQSTSVGFQAQTDLGLQSHPLQTV